MTTLLKSDGSYTYNHNETLQDMLDHLRTRAERTDDLENHKRIRTKIRETSQTADDREFTPAEIKNAIEEVKTKRSLWKTELREKSLKVFISCSPHSRTRYTE